MGEWKFLTNHALVLALLAKHPEITARELSMAIGITERAVRKIIADLEREGYISKEKEGRRARYHIDPRLPFRHHTYQDRAIEVPAIIPQIAESIHEIAKMGHSILLAESNIYHVPDFADRLYVIERGEIIFSGRPEELTKDKAVLKIVAGAA
jgi:DNA-binding transcriptional ArsR family regulator